MWKGAFFVFLPNKAASSDSLEVAVGLGKKIVLKPYLDCRSILVYEIH
jgi:hypothetical protein